MIEIIYTSIALLALMFTWKQWRICMREIARDQLFDLRDEWRDYWHDNGMDMRNPNYAYVRNRINQYLRYTADWKFADTLYIAANSRKIAPIVEEYRAHNAPPTPCPNMGARELHEKIKKSSIEAMRLYMLTTSVMMFPLVVLTVAVVGIKTMAWDMAINKAMNKLAEAFPVSSNQTIESAVTLGNLSYA